MKLELLPEDRADIVRKACPGPGACGGMYTANTMATATEAPIISRFLQGT